MKQHKRLTLKQIKKLRSLRSQGYSINELSKKFKRAKTTLFRYIKDVIILPEYSATWLGKRGGSKRIKLLKESKALQAGSKLVGKRLSRKEMFLFLSALYWAEGSKRDFGLSNTDPALITVFIKSLHAVCRINPDQLRISIRTYEDLDKEKCLDFWSGIVGIPKDKFVNVNVLKGKKHGKLQYGMCRVRVVKGGDLLKKINGINKAVFQTIMKNKPMSP